MRSAADRFGIRAFFATATVVAGFLFAPAAFAGVIDNVEGWAWSGSLGWISMNCTNLGTCGDADYGVTFADAPAEPGHGNLSGYAWTETAGWICFGTTCSGTTPEGGTPYAQYRESDGGRADQIYGWAQVVNLGGDGWISLNCLNKSECGTSNYFTVLDPASGLFTKAAGNDHWAWGSNDIGTGVGWVDMSSVSSTWLSGHLGKIGRPQGVFEPQAGGLAGTHLFTFSIGFTQFSGAKNHRLECELQLPGASTKTIGKTLSATTRGGNESLAYTVDVGDTVQANQLWLINSCLLAGTLTSTACVADSTCAFCDTGAGNKCRALGALTGISCTADADCDAAAICDEGAAKCRVTIDSSAQKRPIFTHGNVWSGLGGGEDQYSAIKCNAGFPGNYFNNPGKCDFTGDASFSLAQRRGIPIEGICNDGLDNDSNGETDCADRYCQGIAYLCKSAAPTACVYGSTGDNILDCNDASYARGSLCCTRQGVTESNANFQHIVNGLECKSGAANDGYFDCGCDSIGAFNASSTDDCYAPGATPGDLCCDTNDNVIEK